MDLRKCTQDNNVTTKGSWKLVVKLTKDQKIVSRAECLTPLILMPPVWNITSTVREDSIVCLSELPGFSLYPSWQDHNQEKEWGTLFDSLRNNKKVAAFELGCYEVYILPPREESKSDPATVKYMELKHPMKKCNGMDSFLASTHPQYLKTLGQTQRWIFGAIAELIDNSRDAQATKVEVGISMVYSKISGREVPMLGVIDDGFGMIHSDLQRMLQFGHGPREAYDPDRIGKYGVGFKTGTMRLGKDVLVLTQTRCTRSIAFLSQSLNEGKNNLEIPIVSYRWTGQCMEVDTDVQDADSAKNNLKVLKNFSPFNKYLIGEKSGIFNHEKTGIFNHERTGTQIYIWNIDESESGLEWKRGTSENSAFNQGNIFIRSKRIRSRTGQISQTVPLDYSLKSYLKFIYLDPRMKIYVQGALVDSRPLAKSLNHTLVESGTILGKPVQLTLGYSQLDWEHKNCGIFLYWHGRLIEAYKRVGSMVNNGDKGHGIIGVIDVTTLMDESIDAVVDNNKQGFHRDCVAYAELEKWLGERADAYLDKYVDNVEMRKGNAAYKPDNEWLQCYQCRKWRKIDTDFDSTTLSLEWSCYMKPFYGLCKEPEEKVQSRVITVSSVGLKDFNRTKDTLHESDSDDDSLVEISASDFQKQSKLKEKTNASEISVQNELRQKVNVRETPTQNKVKQESIFSDLPMQKKLQLNIDASDFLTRNVLRQNKQNNLQHKQRINVSDIPAQNKQNNPQQSNTNDFLTQNELKLKFNARIIPTRNQQKLGNNTSDTPTHNKEKQETKASDRQTLQYKRKQKINTSDIATPNKCQRVSLPRACKKRVSWKGIA